jgi:glycosyltransferase 2 family protein
VGAFFHAVRVFGEQLAAVRWQFLAIALGIHLVRLALRSYAWQTILRAAYPGSHVRYRSVLGAYLAGVGINSIVPARAGDAVKLYLIRHRIKGSSYATLTPTLVMETLFDAIVAAGFIIWAAAIGVLPTHQVYSRLPSVDWGFFVKHLHWTEIGLAVLAGLLVIGVIAFVEAGGEFRARIMRGFAILRYPAWLARGVILPQAVSWVLRVASLYYFLEAFRVHASIHNALLAVVVDSLATLFPATPGGAGTKQGLIVYLFRGEAYTKSLLLAFSVGVNIATVVFNLTCGLIALFLLARTISWRRLRTAQTEEQEQPAES